MDFNDEPGDLYAGTTSTANEFMEFLDQQFDNARPYEASPLIDAGEDDYKLTKPYWHEVIRDHRTNKPNLPQAKTPSAPRGRSSTTSTSTARGGKERPPLGVAQNTSSGILRSRNEKKPHQDRTNRLLGTEDLSTVLKQGWTIAKGWDNRPKVSQINPLAVQDDINRVRERFEKARTPIAQGGTLEGYLAMSRTGNRLHPDAWPENPFIVVDPNRARSPGPRYNLMPDLVKKGIPRQLDYYTVKDITFSKKERFRERKTGTPGVLSYKPVDPAGPSFSAPDLVDVIRPAAPPLQLGPNPQLLTRSGSHSRSRGGSSSRTFSPAAAFRGQNPGSSSDARKSEAGRSASRPASQGPGLSTKVATSGRDFTGSIYYDLYNCPSPAGMYNSNIASRSVSTLMPVSSTIFAPSNRDTRVDRRLQAARRRLDPVQSLRNRFPDADGGGSSIVDSPARSASSRNQMPDPNDEEYELVLAYMNNNFKDE